MPMIIGIPKERSPRERRVALVPDLLPKLARAGVEVVVESGAGLSAGFADAGYVEKGARIADDVLGDADVVLKVQPPTVAEAGRLREGAALVSFLAPHTALDEIQALCSRGVSAFAMELMPRISRAQSMDALSAMATLAGYKAVLLAAVRLPRLFPLLMTAAGTFKSARVFVVGAGVAGLQAIATARRLGAVVEAYDTRPAVKEQVESLGAKFAELPLETAGTEDKGGYAKAQSEEFYERQRATMSKFVAAADAVVTTALVPGQRAPVLITEAMIRSMRPGSVVVDLAAEQGGNCELTAPGEEIERHGVTLIGPINVASTMAAQASQMYGSTVVSYLLHLVKEGALALDVNDELTRGPLVTHHREILSEVVKNALAARGGHPR